MEKDELVFVGRYALLDEHELKATPNRKEIKVNAARLQRIADNGNKRYKNTGDMIPSVIGHTNDDATESNQPPIVGFWKNLGVEPLFDTGKKAVWADHFVYKSKIDLVKKYPRRSVEFWSNRDEIDPVSLLGATTPERDLGLMLFERQNTSDEKPYSYSLSDTKQMADDPKKTDDGAMNEIVAAVAQSDWGKQITTMLGKVVQLIEALEEENKQEPMEQSPPPDANAPPTQDAAKDNNPPPVKLAASTASGSNTSVPSIIPADAEKKNYQMTDEQKTLLENAEKRIKDLEKVVENQKVQYQRDNAKSLLDKAKTVDKIVFEFEEEYKLMEKMPVDIQATHYDRMSRLYARESNSPVEVTKQLDEAVKFARDATGKDGGGAATSFENAAEIASKALKSNMTYEDYVAQHFTKK